MVSETMSAQYGGLVSRLLAFVIDLIIIAIISFLGTAVIGIIAEFFDLSFIWEGFGWCRSIVCESSSGLGCVFGRPDQRFTGVCLLHIFLGVGRLHSR